MRIFAHFPHFLRISPRIFAHIPPHFLRIFFPLSLQVPPLPHLAYVVGAGADGGAAAPGGDAAAVEVGAVLVRRLAAVQGDWEGEGEGEGKINVIQHHQQPLLLPQLFTKRNIENCKDNKKFKLKIVFF